MSGSFLPPVTVEFNANVAPGLAGITKFVKGLAGIGDAARLAAESVDAAFASMASGVEVLTAVADAAKLARTQISGIATAAKRVASASEAASTATESAFTAIGAGADTMATSVDASAVRATEGLARMDEAARAAGLGVTSMGEEIVASMQAAATEMRAAATEMRTSLAGVGRQARATATETGAAGESMGAKFLGLGGVFAKVGKFGSLGLAGIALEAVKTGSSFQAEMVKINTQAGVSKDQIGSLGNGVLKLAGQVGFSPNSLAESLFHVESNFASLGIKGPAALDLVKIAAEGAAVGHANLVDVTNALTAAVASGIPGVQNMSQAMGVLNAIVGSGDMQMQDLANALSTGMVAAVKGYGLTIADVGAGLATFGDNNMRGAAAATNFRMAVQALAVPAKGAGVWLEKFGMTANTLGRDMQKGGLKLALEDLMAHFKKAGITASEQGNVITQMFGKKAGTGLSILLGQMDRVESKYPALSAGASKFGDAWKTTQHNLSQQLAQIRFGFDAVMIRVGQFLIPQVSRLITLLEQRGAPVVKAFGSALSGIASGFSASATAVEKVVQAVSRPTIGPVVAKAGSFTQNLGAFSPFLPDGPTPGMLLPAPAPTPTIGPVTQRATSAPFTQNQGAAAPSSLVQTQRFNPFLPGGPTAGMLLPTPAVPAPKMTGWQKVGEALRSVASDLRKFGEEAAKAFELLMKAAGPTLVLLGTVGLGALKLIAQILANVVGPALVKVTGFMNEHKGAVRDLIAVALIPLALRLAALSIIKPVMAIAGLAKSIVTFPFGQASKIVTSVKGVAQSLFGAAAVTDAEGNVTPAVEGLFSKLSKGFSKGWETLGKGASTFWRGLGRGASAAAGGLSTAWSNISTGARIAGDGLQQAGQAALGLASNAGRAVASMASSAWSGAVAGAQAIAGALGKAALAAWDFAVKAAAATAAALKQAASFVIDTVATAAETVAEIAETVATTVGTAALAAFDVVLVIATAPITLIILAILALVAAVVWIAMKTTWFETAWSYAWNAIKGAALAVWHVLDNDVIHPIGAAFSWLWSNAIAPALRFIVGGFLDMAGTILHAASDMLGWVPGIGGTLKGASKQFDSFKNSVMASLGGAAGAADGLTNAVNNIPKLVTITFNGVNQGTLSGHTYTSTTGQSYADGGIRYAASGLMNQAGMARAGSNILWAERSTGGESFIPHALSKRPRSREIAEKTVGILGGAVAWGGPGSAAPLPAGGSSGPSPAYGGGGGTTVVYNVNVNVAGTVTSERNLRDTIQSQLLQLGARNSQTYQAYKR